MSTLLVAGSFIIAFLLTFLCVPGWRRLSQRFNIVGKDMNKIGEVKVSEMGGVTVILGFLAGSFWYLGFNTFLFNPPWNITFLGLISTVLMIAVIGMFDDLLGWKLGFKQWQKPLLTIPAVIPMILVNFGRSLVDVPFLGMTNLGVLYPLLLVPLAVVGAANGFNLVAGYNGLEAGMGVIILGTLSGIAWLKGLEWVGVIGFICIASLFAFLWYNWYPAKLFPGDSLTYPIGALIGCVAVFGKVEKIGLLLFIPYFIDLVLPLRRRFKVEAFAKVNPDGSLDQPYARCYDITHVAIFLLKKIKKKVYERDVVYLLLSFELILAGVAWIWALR